LEIVLSSIRSVISGDFKENNFGLMFQEFGFNKPLSLSNLSAGMKPFLIIKRLLETGKIREQSFFILDEPEIHLHPEWQIKFAELLVLLQREFNLTVLLTTHSPYFLNAIEVYSEKNHTLDNCNYYLAKNDGNYCSVQDVTQNTDDIYKLLAKPFQKLENIRYE
jgi:predicted ATPase